MSARAIIFEIESESYTDFVEDFNPRLEPGAERVRDAVLLPGTYQKRTLHENLHVVLDRFVLDSEFTGQLILVSWHVLQRMNDSSAV
jgi:hypothetical protein